MIGFTNHCLTSSNCCMDYSWHSFSCPALCALLDLTCPTWLPQIYPTISSAIVYLSIHQHMSQARPSFNWMGATLTEARRLIDMFSARSDLYGCIPIRPVWLHPFQTSDLSHHELIIDFELVSLRLDGLMIRWIHGDFDDPFILSACRELTALLWACVSMGHRPDQLFMEVWFRWEYVP